ncbi:MAG: F0F1 ATP synthase subunit B' [Alphaproteobacteria bacterium]|nr:F0F1 ATP synthase subunit B' [Alphaproteobacteria bacterium]
MRIWLHNLALLFLPMLALPAWAEEAAGEAAETAHAGGGDQLPQFDIGFYPSQLFWLLVCFGIVYLLMGHVALPRVQKVIGERQKRLAADLAEAGQASERAKELGAASEKSLADARAKAHASVTDLQQKAQAEAAAQQAAQQGELNARLADAEKRIAAARTQAMSHVQDVAADVARESLRKLAGIDVSPADIKAALDRADREAA